MKEDWKECKLGELVEINQNSFSEKENWTFVNYLDTGSITENKISEIQYISLIDEKLPSRAKRKVKKNSIVYSTVRPNQKHFGIIKLFPENFLVSTGFAVLDVNEKIANPDFIYYYLIQNENTESLHAIAEQTTSAYPAIKPSDIADISIKLPPLATQQKIAQILSSLDDKIELNNKINDNLEQQAQAIFKSWFVDNSEKNHTIGDYIVPKRGKNLSSKDAIWGDVPVVAGGLEPATYHNSANTKPPVLTISASGANAGFVNLWNIPVWSSDSSFIDLTMTKEVYFWYVLLKLRQKEIFDSQTGSAQPHIYPQHISVLPIAELDMTKVSEFTKTVTPLFGKISENQQENRTLTTIRDTLLPKLMNGEIEVDSIQI